jgi:hypothetical protein
MSRFDKTGSTAGLVPQDDCRNERSNPGHLMLEQEARSRSVAVVQNRPTLIEDHIANPHISQ